MNHLSRIALSDTAFDAITKLVDGNPGAIVACTELMKDAHRIDPDSAFGAFGPLYHLDTLGIYGEDIHRLCKDVAGGDVIIVHAMLRAVQLGQLGETVLRRKISERSRLDPFEAAAILARVRAQLPDFAKSVPAGYPAS